MSTEQTKMQYVRLGNTGLKVSRICLGCMSYGDPKSKLFEWTLAEEESRPFFKRALELGINFFDTADLYSYGASEEITGRALKDFAKRDEVVIATKVFFPHKDKPNSKGLSRKHIMDSINVSLKRLGTDYIDLYQIHRWDNETPIEQTMEALHDVVKSGKALYIGASSMHAWQFAKAQHIAKERGFTQFVSMQNHYNLIYREEEREMIPQCLDMGVGLIPWSPLARGLLGGNYKPGQSKLEGATSRAKTDNFTQMLYGSTIEQDFPVIERCSELASKKNCTSAQVALAWMLNKPGVAAPIVGATKMKYLEEAVGALDIKISPEEMKYLEELYKPHPIKGHS